MEEKNTFYSPAEVAEKLDVSTSTVRRLTGALEEEGYSRIVRNEKNHRRYDISDVRAIEYLHSRINDGGLTQKEAVKDTLNNIDYVLNKIDPVEISENKDDQLKDLTDKMNILIEIVGGLNNKITEQSKEITELKEEVRRSNERLPAPTIDRLPYDHENTISDKETDDIETIENVGGQGVGDTVSDNINEDKEGAHVPTTDDKETAEDVSEQQEETITESKKGFFGKIASMFKN